MSYQTVVVGYDGSGDADQAVAAAADQVAPGGTVHVVTAYHPESNTRLIRTIEQLPEEFRYVYDPETSERERQQPALEQLASLGVSFEGHIVSDDAASAIIDVAGREQADLVVVGSRGLGGMQRFLRGSVSTRVATHAPTSVLIVHAP
jgi:nucleotide-binding universal stress UspA family protein